MDLNELPINESIAQSVCNTLTLLFQTRKTADKYLALPVPAPQPYISSHHSQGYVGLFPWSEQVLLALTPIWSSRRRLSSRLQSLSQSYDMLISERSLRILNKVTVVDREVESFCVLANYRIELVHKILLSLIKELCSESGMYSSTLARFELQCSFATGLLLLHVLCRLRRFGFQRDIVSLHMPTPVSIG